MLPLFFDAKKYRNRTMAMKTSVKTYEQAFL